MRRLHVRRVAWCAAIAGHLASTEVYAQTVAQIAARGACSTDGVVGISNQLVRTQLCMFPGVFVSAAPHAGVTLTSSRIHALMAAPARDAPRPAGR